MITNEKNSEALHQQACELIGKLTVEEKARLCAGSDFWHLAPVEKLGIPALMVTDGPNGLRKQEQKADHLGIQQSVAATCFPTAATTACSFDPELLKEMGEAMGEECLEEKVAVILGPAVNIKRSPLCGRNFEYFSEDPVLAGDMAAGMIDGVQSKNVGTSLKHYAANSQEKARLVSDSVLDERTLHEIYLAGFERAIKKSQPWTVMCSYNRINGIYASDNKELMDDILRKDWGFEGLVMTDWGAMNDRVQGIRAGLDLEMPGPCEENCKKIVDAVAKGELKEEELDTCAARIMELILKAKDNPCDKYDREAHNDLAGKIAEQSAVLLRRGNALPADKNARIAVIGDFAKNARFQGAGSGKTNPHKITALCDALDSMGIKYSYAQGYESENPDPDETKIAEAVAVAKDADVVFACVGLPASFESEGFDRTHMELPKGQNELMEALAAAGTPVVAVLSTGSSVILPWRDKVDSILLMYLAGQNGGTAAARLLFGDAVPGGKLAESWPLALEDNSSYKYFGDSGKVEYRENIYVGYRYYDKAGVDVQYPFGFGLSYTDFEYSDMKLSTDHCSKDGKVTVELIVTNTGKYSGSEIVQLYVAPTEGKLFRPVRELKAFTKVALEPGESKTVTMDLCYRDFAVYSMKENDWVVPEGMYKLEAAASSRDIRLTSEIKVDGAADETDYREAAPGYYDVPAPFEIDKEQFEAVLGHKVEPMPPKRPFTANSTLGDIAGTTIGDELIAKAKAAFSSMGDVSVMFLAMLEDMPLRQFIGFSHSENSGLDLDTLLTMLNADDNK